MKKIIRFTAVYFFLFVIILYLGTEYQAQNYYPKSDQIADVLQRLKKDYVDSQRLEPYTMLEATLENLARHIPPVVLQELKGNPFSAVTIQVDKAKKEFIIPKLKNLADLANTLQKIVIYIKQNLPKEKDLKNIDYVAINGFLSVLDPYTSLLVPEVYTEFREDTDGNYSGVGMYIGIRDAKLQVISPIFNSPAYKAGIKAKDIILQINEESTINMSTGTASSKIKGLEGTKVNLLIQRKEFNKPKNFAITRARISLTSANALELKTKEGRIGYLSISRFHQKTAKEVETALKKLKINYSDFQGIILDLRNNPGGILQQAVKVSDKFLAQGRIVTTAGISNKPRIAYNARGSNSIIDTPIIILMNGSSASAAEILGAALKQNKRAIVLGTTSFGKGSVQQLRQFQDGSALKLTIAKYLTPNNNSLHSIGITPHIEVNPWIIDGNSINIINNKELNANKKDKFAEWGGVPDKPIRSFNYLFDKDFQHNIFSTSEQKQDIAGFDIDSLKKDYLLYFASKILETSKVKDLPTLSQTVIATTKLEEQIQNTKLKKKLEEIGISWRQKLQGTSEVEVKFWVEKKRQNNEACLQARKDRIQAGDEIYLCVVLKNTTKQETIRLQATGNSPYPIFNKKQFVFGNIPAGKTKKWFVPINIPAYFANADIPFTIKLLDFEEKEIIAHQFFFNINQIPQPQFQYSLQAYSKTSKIEAPNSIKLDIQIFNKSNVDSGKLNISLKNGEGKKIFLTAAKDTVNSLAKKKQKKSEFKFDLKHSIPDGAIDLSFSLLDSKYNKHITHNFTIPYGAEGTQTITNSAPSINIKSYPLQTKKEKITLEFTSEDDKKIKDFYIFANDKKEFYRSFGKQKILHDIAIKLKTGLNKIIFFSRDNYDVTTLQQIYIYRQN